MMDAMTLVIGATGNVGSHVVQELRAREMPVRAFVRDPERARALLGGDVELVVGDLADRATVASAVTGVARVFLSCGNVPRQVELECTAIDAAAAAGVERLVKLSAAAAAVDSPLLFPRWQGEIEEHLQGSPVPSVVLRPVDYMTNVLAFAEGIRRTGKLFAPLGGARTGMIDPRDVAAVGVLALAEPGHVGRSYTMTGPEAITYDEIARQLSRATGRTIEFVDIPDDVARREMLADGMPPLIVDFLVDLFGAMRRGLAAETTDTVRTLTGRQPHDFASFARAHADAFRA
jgi:uncharacterized protein YbjT (DUF2867 family)